MRMQANRMVCQCSIAILWMSKRGERGRREREGEDSPCALRSNFIFQHL
jgi:hypothetical protein